MEQRTSEDDIKSESQAPCKVRFGKLRLAQVQAWSHTSLCRMSKKQHLSEQSQTASVSAGNARRKAAAPQEQVMLLTAATERLWAAEHVGQETSPYVGG